jgi:hypothetical protein
MIYKIKENLKKCIDTILKKPYGLTASIFVLGSCFITNFYNFIKLICIHKRIFIIKINFFQVYKLYGLYFKIWMIFCIFLTVKIILTSLNTPIIIKVKEYKLKIGNKF